jgi:tetratricopeptide (TPR) repeat protein
MPSKQNKQNNSKVKTKTEKVSANDEREELSALMRSIKLSQKYYLYFVNCNQVPYQDKLIKQIKSELAEKQIEVIKFKKPITNLLQEITPLLKDKTPDAIFIQGLERSISSDGKGKENALIHKLNISRDAFNDAFPCPIYLWLPSYALIKTVRHAPDFFSVRSGVFYFSAPAEKVIGDIFTSTNSEWLETSSLPIAEKQKRIANLESLLAEYQGLHSEKRDKVAEMRLYDQLATLFHSISDYRKAIDYHEKALLIAHNLNDFNSQSISLNELGNIYNELENYEKAIETIKLALKISKFLEDEENEGINLGNLGNSYLSLGNTKKAANYFKRAITIAKKYSDERNLGAWLSNLGAIYSTQQEYKKAIAYYEKSLDFSRRTGDKQIQAHNLGNIGNAYQNLGQYTKAAKYYKEAFEIATKIGYKQGIGHYLWSLGSAYHNLGENKKARDYYLQAIKILEAIESPYAEEVKNFLAILESESET